VSSGSSFWSASGRWAATQRMTDNRDGVGRDDGGGGFVLCLTLLLILQERGRGGR
jgi:hypothetical protein